MKNEVFCSAGHPCDLLTLNLLSEFYWRGLGERPLPAQVGGEDGFADQRRAQSPGNGFNFGEFRHACILAGRGVQRCEACWGPRPAALGPNSGPK